MAIPPCKAADDPTGCRQGNTADLRVQGYCGKHHNRIRAFGSPYLHHPGPGRPRRGQQPVSVFVPAPARQGWPLSTARKAAEALRTRSGIVAGGLSRVPRAAKSAALKILLGSAYRAARGAYGRSAARDVTRSG